MSKSILDFYMKFGYSLENKGINESIIPFSLTEEFFELCKKEKILILGGDIYEKIQDNEFLATYDNWYYDGSNSIESILEAQIYLNKLRKENLYISFIFK